MLEILLGLIDFVKKMVKNEICIVQMFMDVDMLDVKLITKAITC